MAHPTALPNLLLAGFPKCGTSSVRDTLVGHPDVCGAEPFRSTNYFTPRVYDGDAPLPSVSAYASHFASWAGEAVRIDDTVVYVYGVERVTSAIRDVLGRPRVLLMLREPVSRTASYLSWKKRNAELRQDVDLASYVDACERLGPRAVDTLHLNPYSGLHGSDYGAFLPAWIEAFGDELRIDFLENLERDPIGFFRAIAAWLCIDAGHFTADRIRTSNRAAAIRYHSLQRVFRIVGRKLRPLAEASPRSYRFLSERAHRFNSAPLNLGPPADDIEQRLRGRFASALPALRGQLRGRTLLDVPAWVDQ